MRRLFALVVAATAAALSLVGCGSDSDGDSPSNAGSGGESPSDAGSGGESPISQCVANNAEFTAAEFLAQTEEGKACSDASDANTVCANDMPLIGGTCGKGCLGMGDDTQQAQCVAECVQVELDKSHSDPLSEACLACYVADIECARKECLLQCAVEPSSPGCFTCRTDKGCVDAFYACSGLPEPGAGSGT